MKIDVTVPIDDLLSAFETIAAKATLDAQSISSLKNRVRYLESEIEKLKSAEVERQFQITCGDIIGELVAKIAFKYETENQSSVWEDFLNSLKKERRQALSEKLPENQFVQRLYAKQNHVILSSLLREFELSCDDYEKLLQIKSDRNDCFHRSCNYDVLRSERCILIGATDVKPVTASGIESTCADVEETELDEQDLSALLLPRKFFPYKDVLVKAIDILLAE